MHFANILPLVSVTLLRWGQLFNYGLVRPKLVVCELRNTVCLWLTVVLYVFGQCWWVFDQNKGCVRAVLNFRRTWCLNLSNRRVKPNSGRSPIFPWKLMQIILAKSWNPPTDLRSATSQKYVVFSSTFFELAYWLNTFPRVLFCALFCWRHPHGRTFPWNTSYAHCRMEGEIREREKKGILSVVWTKAHKT